MSTRQRIAFAVAVVAALGTAACDTPTVPVRTAAYNFTTPDGVIYRWQTGARIGVYVVPTADPERAGLLEAAVDHAVRAWNEAVLFGEYELVETALADADVVVAWANETLPLNTTECQPAPGGIAWTTFCLEDGVTIDDVLESSSTLTDVVYGYPLSSGQHSADGVHMIVQVLYNSSNTDAVAGLVTHEFGHVLGIGRHPCDYDSPSCARGYGAFESVMYLGEPERSAPARADRETIEILYRTRPHMTP